jgi:hypothetical protein
VKKYIWLIYAKKQNTADADKGRQCCYDLHLQKTKYTDMKIWGVMDYTICNGHLNIANSIVKLTWGGEGNFNVG